MYVMSDKGVAIVLMIISLWCLGSWPALFNVLERRGRVPMHTYMDYTIATYCVAVGFALTLGEIGGSSANYPNFTTQLFQVQPISVPDPPSFHNFDALPSLLAASNCHNMKRSGTSTRFFITCKLYDFEEKISSYKTLVFHDHLDCP